MIVNGHGVVLFISPLNIDEADGMVGEIFVQGQGQIEAAVLLQQMHYLKQENTTLETEIQLFKASVNELLGKLHRAVTRIANDPIMYSRVRNMERGAGE